MRLDGECSCNEDADASDGSIIGSVNDDWMGLRKVHSALSCLIVDVGGEESNGNGGSRARLDGESVGGRRHTKYSSDETNYDLKRHNAVPIARCHQTSQRRDQIVLIGEGDPVSPSPNCCLSWRLNCRSNR